MRIRKGDHSSAMRDVHFLGSANILLRLINLAKAVPSSMVLPYT